MSASTRYFPLGLAVVFILPALKERIDFSEGEEAEEGAGRCRPFRMERSS